MAHTTVEAYADDANMRMVPLGTVNLRSFGKVHTMNVFLLINPTNIASICYIERSMFPWVSNQYPYQTELPIVDVCEYIFENYMYTWSSITSNLVLMPVYNKALEYLDKVVGSGMLDSGNRLADIARLKQYVGCDPQHTLMPRTWQKLEELLEIESLYRFKEHKSKTIQARWREVIVDPGHPICRRRLMYEFNEIVTSYPVSFKA